MQATAIQTSFSAEKTSTSTKTLWAGRIISGFVVFFLLVDAGFKLIRPLPAEACVGDAVLMPPTKEAS